MKHKKRPACAVDAYMDTQRDMGCLSAASRQPCLMHLLLHDDEDAKQLVPQQVAN